VGGEGGRGPVGPVKHTVNGIIVESGERWAGVYETYESITAEDMARADVERMGATLVVAVTYDHELPNDDPYTWFDPDVTTQDQMNSRLVELGWIAGPDAGGAEQERDEAGSDLQLGRLVVAVVVISVLCFAVGLLTGWAIL
jgi:hypothetical protein